MFGLRQDIRNQMTGVKAGNSNRNGKVSKAMALKGRTFDAEITVPETDTKRFCQYVRISPRIIRRRRLATI